MRAANAAHSQGEIHIVTPLVLLAVSCGALTRSTFAFGEAVVAMPLLTMLPIGLHTAVPLVGLVGLTVTVITMVFGGWRNIVRTEVVPWRPPLCWASPWV